MMESNLSTSKEQTIFSHTGSTIQLDDREIEILARFEDPLVVLLGNMLSDEECSQLIASSKSKMKRSKVGALHTVNDMRTSTGMFFNEKENELVAAIEKRAAAVMNVPIEHGDALQVLNYAPGQEYKAHFDFFSASSPSAKNNRISTLIMYLNDVEQGGHTFFPALPLSITPKKGTAVYFEYFYTDPALNARTLHGGAPVVSGEKWVATQWMRKQKVRSC